MMIAVLIVPFCMGLSLALQGGFQKRDVWEVNAVMSCGTYVTRLGWELTYPITIDESIRTKNLFAYHAHSYNLDRSNTFGAVINYYFLIVMALLAIGNFFNHIGLDQRRNLFFKFFNKIKGSYLVPAIFKGKHAQYLRGKKFCVSYCALLPSRIEFIILLGYAILHTVLLSYDYIIDPNNVLFKSKNLQLVRYFADRTGILAFAHFPIIIIFSTRNNIFESLTGLHYSSFIAFHKWLGRFMTLDAILHSVFYVIYSLCYHTFENSRKQAYWQFGTFAIVALISICIFSLAYMRIHYYETFLILHIILAVLLFICCWKHVEKIGWGQWLCFAIFFWVVEKLTRVCRLCTFGVRTAKLKLFFDDVGAPEYVQVTIYKGEKLKNWNAKAGQYGFVYFLIPRFFWQSHPFTIEDDGDYLRIVIRPKDGLTNKLVNYVLKNGVDGEMSVWLSIEGPYGCSLPLKHYDDVILVSGGSGIPGPLAHAIECLPMVKTSASKFVELVIIARDTNILKAYAKDLLKLKNSPVTVTLYLTTKYNNHRIQKFDVPDSSTPLLQESSSMLVELLSFIPIHYGRPNIAKIIDGHCKEKTRSLAVVTCGPPVLVDNIRSHCAERMANSETTIGYFEEFQCCIYKVNLTSSNWYSMPNHTDDFSDQEDGILLQKKKVVRDAFSKEDSDVEEGISDEEADVAEQPHSEDKEDSAEAQLEQDKAEKTNEQQAGVAEPVSEEKRKQSKIDKIIQRKAGQKLKHKTGVVYLSRIPPYMKPAKMRQILSRFGEIDRLFLKREDEAKHKQRTRGGGNKKIMYEEGWAEFIRKRDAKLCAETLNGNIIGGKKGSFYHDDILNVKYLPGFKWADLTEQIARENDVRQAKLELEISQSNKLNAEYIRNVEQSKMLQNMRKRKDHEDRDQDARRQFKQHKVSTNRADAPSSIKNKSETSVKDVLSSLL
ncbi:Pre-rRNA-processing protein ESF2 [Nakaseomyces glabratus]|nr:Pre-rRNA-processing protein ESF2 [Nakaseomyces glabratus]KTB17093.1 Pre-rRNA-processing protein ESF2 [Nakaseomyces glabratus]